MLKNQFSLKNVIKAAAICGIFFICVTAAEGQFLRFISETQGFLEGIEYPERQLFSSDNRYFYVASSPGLSIFKFDSVSGALENTQIVRLDNLGMTDFFISAMELTPDEKHIFVLGKNPPPNTAPRILVFDRDELTGRVTFSTEYAINLNQSSGDIKVSPDGKHLYLSGFGIATFDIEPVTGNLVLKDQSFLQSSARLWISGDGNFLYVQASTYMQVYSRNSASGLLTLVEDNFTVPRGIITPTKDETLLFIPDGYGFGPGIAIIRRDVVTGKMTKLGVHKNPITDPEPGFGPSAIRDMMVSGADDFLHVAAAQGGNVTSYQINKLLGTLTLIDTKSGNEYASCSVRMSMSHNENIFYINTCGPAGPKLTIYQNDGNGILNENGQILTGATLHRGLSIIQSSILSADGRYLYLLSAGDSSLSAYDTEAPGGPALVNKINEQDVNMDSYGNGDLVLSPDNSFIYTINYSTSSLLYFERNAATGVVQYAGNVNLPETLLFDFRGKIKFSPDGNHAYVVADGHDIIIYDRNSSTGALSLNSSIHSLNGVDFKHIGDIGISPDNKNLYMGSEKRYVNYSVNPSTGLLQYLQDSTALSENAFLPRNEVTVTADGTNVYFYISDFLHADLDIYQRDPSTGRINWNRTQGYNLDRFQFNFDQNYLLSSTTYVVNLFKRDMLDSGRLIFLGHQNLAGYGSIHYASNRKEQYHFKPDNKTIVAVRSRGAVLIYQFEDKFPPSPPVDLTAKNEVGQVVLSWKRNFEPDVISYLIYRGSNPDSQYSSLIAETTDTTFIDITQNVEFSYWIKAKNATGMLSEFGWRVLGYGIDLPPTAPTNLNAVAGDRSISLSWDANTEVDLKEYRVVRGTINNSAYYTAQAVTQSNAYVDHNVNEGTNYFYWVSARDNWNHESDFSIGASASPFDLAPGTPQHLSGTASGRVVHLTWDSNSESDLNQYQLHRNILNDYLNSQSIGNTNQLSFTETVSSAATYYYWLTAVDLHGHESLASDPVAVNVTDVIIISAATTGAEGLTGVHPNPANLSLLIDGAENALYIFQIINATGEVVLDGSANSEIDISDLKDGLYMVRFKTANSILNYRFIKAGH